MNAHTLSISPQPSATGLRTSGGLIIGLAVCAVLGSAVAASLGGIGAAPQNVPETYFNHGQTITVGDQSLDLSKMIFVRGEVCPDKDSIGGSSSFNSIGCSLADSRIPTSVVAIAANKLQEPVFKVEVATTDEITEGWVGFNNLRN